MYTNKTYKGDSRMFQNNHLYFVFYFLLSTEPLRIAVLRGEVFQNHLHHYSISTIR